MFCDEVSVHFTAGRGGNGCIGFRREAYVPRGGPNGGDGGKGGSIYVMANENINTLAEFNTHRVFRAHHGENGLGKEMAGKAAEDLFLPVPLGTLVYDEKKCNLLADLKTHGDAFCVARGGKGGFGNTHFKSSTRQTPRFAELGEPGKERRCVLELKLVADVGIIGLPSVGKSTLLSRISNARPKIAEYHFTTLVPNLGFVTLKEFGGSLQQNFLACDLPGLIEGAHEGKGLGIKFLKHVARNRVLVHLLDINALDPVKDYKTVRRELRLFDRHLPKKPEIVVFNKIDTIDVKTAEEVMRAFRKKNRTVKKIFAISCVAGKGLAALIFEIWNVLEKEKIGGQKAELLEEEGNGIRIFRPHLEADSHSFEVKQMKGGKKKRIFEVTGPRIEQIAVMTNFDNHEAVSRIYDVFEKMGISRELRRAGAKFGDEVRIGKQTVLYRWE